MSYMMMPFATIIVLFLLITTTSALRQIVYVSHSVGPSTPHEDLQDILLTCRRRNSLLGVTGLLLYRDGAFAQLLEGSNASMKIILDAIERDRRHAGMTYVLDRQTDTRSFSAWNIAFRNLEYTKEMNEWADDQSQDLTEAEQQAFDETFAAMNDPPRMNSAIARLIEVYQRILLKMEPHPTLQNQWARPNKISNALPQQQN